MTTGLSSIDPLTVLAIFATSFHTLDTRTTKNVVGHRPVVGLGNLLASRSKRLISQKMCLSSVLCFKVGKKLFKSLPSSYSDMRRERRLEYAVAVTQEPAERVCDSSSQCSSLQASHESCQNVPTKVVSWRDCISVLDVLDDFFVVLRRSRQIRVGWSSCCQEASSSRNLSSILVRVCAAVDAVAAPISRQHFSSSS